MIGSELGAKSMSRATFLILQFIEFRPIIGEVAVMSEAVMR